MTTLQVQGGPALPQERRLVTEIPGPVSREWTARRQAAVSSAVSVMMPVFAVAAGGGVVVDADGNSLIDFGCVWINTHIPLVAEMPHGGFGHSGYGKDLSMYGFEDYTRVKHVMSSIA